jgi:hypothetical protein
MEEEEDRENDRSSLLPFMLDQISSVPLAQIFLTNDTPD